MRISPDDGGSPLMSVVLYALGVVLLLWSGYLLVSGDMIATLDIAANLAGSGALAIGFGAVVDAVARLTRAVAVRAHEVAPTESAAPANFTRREPQAPPLQQRPEPVFIRRDSDEDERPAEPEFESLRRGPEPPHAPAPSVDRTPSVRPRLPVVERAEPTEPAVEAPPVVAPILGGGVLAARDVERPREPEVEPAAAEVPSQVDDDLASPAEIEASSAEQLDDEAAPEPKPMVEPSTVAAAPEPRVPEWLARARARREARAHADGPDAAPESDGPDDAIDDPNATVAEAALPMVDEPVEEPEALETERPASEEVDPSRQVVREGEHNGVYYRFFADGSIEAQREHGARRFASLEELRATIIAARGKLEDDEEGAPASAAAEEPVDATETPEPEPEINAADPEPEPAPEPATTSDDEFEAALAELEGRPSDAARPDRSR